MSGSASKRVCFLCLVSGRVQGVFFRASTRIQAEKLGLSGHARNLSDGRVEVLACGAAEAVRDLRVWLLRGPPHAEVSDLDCQPVEVPPPSGFSTG